METGALGIRVTLRGDDHETREALPVVYTVTGVPQTDRCEIVFAGTNASGTRMWAIQWSRSRERVKVPSALYESPEAALAVIEQMLPEVGQG
jgi:hypothetical protein